MPQTPNYGFDYEEPTSLPGTTLTGGVMGDSPILAVQVDTTMASVEALANATAADVVTNTGDIAAVTSDVADLTDWTVTGTELITFTNQASHTVIIPYGITFPSRPMVVTNIDSGAGVVARWGSRAISIQDSQFTMFLFATDDNGTETQTWSDIPVSWMATYRP